MPTGILIGLGTTATQLGDSRFKNRKGIRVKADVGNLAEYVFVGEGPDVTAGTNDAHDGYLLAAGEYIDLPASRYPNLSRVWVIGSNADLVAEWICDGEDEGFRLDLSYLFDSQYLPLVY